MRRDSRCGERPVQDWSLETTDTSSRGVVSAGQHSSRNPVGDKGEEQSERVGRTPWNGPLVQRLSDWREPGSSVCFKTDFACLQRASIFASISFSSSSAMSASSPGLGGRSKFSVAALPSINVVSIQLLKLQDGLHKAGGG